MVRQSEGRVAFEARGRNGVPALVSTSSFAPGHAHDLLAFEGDPSGHTALPEAAGQRLHGRRIVLAEDDSAIALLFANLLREQGATVHEFTDGRLACEAAQRERPANKNSPREDRTDG